MLRKAGFVPLIMPKTLVSFRIWRERRMRKRECDTWPTASWIGAEILQRRGRCVLLDDRDPPGRKRDIAVWPCSAAGKQIFSFRVTVRNMNWGSRIVENVVNGVAVGQCAAPHDGGKVERLLRTPKAGALYRVFQIFSVSASLGIKPR